MKTTSSNEYIYVINSNEYLKDLQPTTKNILDHDLVVVVEDYISKKKKKYL